MANTQSVERKASRGQLDRVVRRTHCALIGHCWHDIAASWGSAWCERCDHGGPELEWQNRPGQWRERLSGRWHGLKWRLRTYVTRKLYKWRREDGVPF